MKTTTITKTIPLMLVTKPNFLLLLEYNTIPTIPKPKPITELKIIFKRKTNLDVPVCFLRRKKIHVEDNRRTNGHFSGNRTANRNARDQEITKTCRRTS